MNQTSVLNTEKRDYLRFTATLGVLAFVFYCGAVYAASPINAPSIAITPDVYYPLDEIFYLEGRVAPNVPVQIQFQKQGARPLRFSAKSDQTGEWVLAEKIPLENGDWEVRARIFGAGDDAVSEWSNPRVFKAIVSGVTIGGVNIKFAFLSLVIVLCMIAGGVILSYFTIRVRQLKARLVAKEIREAHTALREGLSDIRRDLLDELRLLETGGKQLSQDELSHKDHILRELDRVEKTMERQLEIVEEKI